VGNVLEWLIFTGMSTATPIPRILLVSKPSEAAEISGALVAAGFSAPAIAAGGDDTLTLYEEAAPDVVVLCASLEQGDARSLAAALREASPRRAGLRIVLVGDAGGPIRNALDAADFEVDRFVGRPLSAKALAFAVRSCAREAAEALAASAGATAAGESGEDAVWPTPRPLTAPPQPPPRIPIMRSATTPGTGPGMPPAPSTIGRRSRRPPAAGSATLDRAMEEAITRFVSDAMSALETGWRIDIDRDSRRDAAVTSSVEGPAGGPAGRALAAPPGGLGGDPTSRTVSADPGGAKGAGPAAEEKPENGADTRDLRERRDDAAGESAWQEPPAAPAWREPTLILPNGGQLPPIKGGPDAAKAAPARLSRARSSVPDPIDPDDLDVTARQAASPWDDDEDDDAPADAGRGQPDSAVTPPGEERPRSPLARELRRKMSMMAERLFPGRARDRSGLDVGPAHDPHTDIDLASIGLESPESDGGVAPYEGIGRVDTFADTNPLSELEPTPPSATPVDESEETTGRRRSITGEPPARGDLADLDVASLVGRLLQSKFTGRVQFRRGPAEKAIQFEDGRPVFAVSNLPHDRMGDLLYREGKITGDQQQRARDLVVESGRRMGEILVEIGFLKPRELLPAVRHHIEDIVYSLFAWDAGEFAIVAGEPTAERIRMTRHPAAIVLEGVRRKYGPEQLETRIGSAAAVVSVRSQRQLGAIAAVADLSPTERAVIQKLDGERTIQQAAEAAQVEPLVALQLAFALVALGVAEVVDHGPSPLERTPTRPRSLVGETDIKIDRQRVLAKHALVHEADYFTLLGVRRDATSFEIRRAYEAARRDYAAGGFPPELQRELAGELGDINRVIDEAYQVLRDERVRRSYQANLLD
jgi:DNA-binding NarL/FixJ family response regulator